MELHDIGIRVPEDFNADATAEQDATYVENEETGMCGSYSASLDGETYIVELWPESGGVSHWYRAYAREDAARFLDSVERVQVRQD